MYYTSQLKYSCQRLNEKLERQWIHNLKNILRQKTDFRTIEHQLLSEMLDLLSDIDKKKLPT